MKTAIRWVLAICFGVVAVAVQYLALLVLLRAIHGESAAPAVLSGLPLSVHGGLPSFFVVQFFASLLSAVFFLLCGPAKMRTPWWQGVLLHTCFIFFVPVAGQLIVAGIMLLQRVVKPTRVLKEAKEIALPSFVPKLLDRVHPGGTARARSLVVNDRVNVRERMTAMNSVRGVSPHATGRLLHELLADNQDEIRLLAYGILEQTEKRIMSDIREVQANLERNKGSRHAAINHARLAELHWELVYQGLVQGEVYRYTFERVQEHARSALLLRPKLAGMHFLLGRCALLLRSPDSALTLFQEAQDCGMSESRLAVWRAEALFLEGRLDEVSRSMNGVPLSNASGSLQAVVRYWQ